ncbi:sigma-70 family RNA polymerase sigma factor [Candidatus Daviesbacteria bacterium]|nr:sigma-70 family RNA polymerase sigma factor [Candidatus Daviesbacteria bacterium]
MTIETLNGTDIRTPLRASDRNDIIAGHYQTRFEVIVKGVTRRSLLSPEAAEDIVQDAYMHALTRSGTVTAASVNGWINRIVGNDIIDFFRSQRAARRDAKTVYITYGGDEIPILPSDPRGNPENIFLYNEEVAGLVGNLTPEQQAVVAGRFYGFSHPEIAQALKITVNSSKKRFARATAAMKRRLKREAVLYG